MDLFDKADYEGQDKVIPTLEAIFSGCTDLNIVQHYDDKCGVDLHMTATTENTEAYYAIECKDRKMEHTRYADDGYIIEDKKIRSLMAEHKKGYKPIFLNSFSDGHIVIWDLSKIDFDECGCTGERTFFRTEVTRGNSGIEVKNKITLKNSQAVWIGKMAS